MTTHDLKCWPEYYEPLARGEKMVELRLDDRGYQVGDVLRLREWEPLTKEYSGRETLRCITHIMRGSPWLSSGYVALSLGHVATALAYAEQ